MNNISFKSNYKINPQTNFPYKAFAKFEYKMEQKGVDFYSEKSEKADSLSKIGILCPDELDKKIEKFLASKGINFEKYSISQALNLENIVNRIELPQELKYNDDFELVVFDTAKIEKELSKDEYCHVGYKGQNGIHGRYENFINYLKTGKKISAPIVIFKENESKLIAGLYDGRHRFAVLRDLGIEKIPLAIDKESLKIARKYGII